MVNTRTSRLRKHNAADDFEVYIDCSEPEEKPFDAFESVDAAIDGAMADSSEEEKGDQKDAAAKNYRPGPQDGQPLLSVLTFNSEDRTT